MELRFWGVRGSIASPGEHTVNVGGNTTCLSVRCDDYLFVFDAGTGIRRLGAYLDSHDTATWRGSIFFTHYHWDHIQGLPFFMPARRTENRFRLFGEKKRHFDLEAVLRHQMQDPFFPVDLDEAPGLVDFTAIGPGQHFEIHKGFTIATLRLNHPGESLGYRLFTPEGSLCVITDHEHPHGRLDRDVVEFARGADVLVHEAQYSPEEKNGPKRGWGHSSWVDAAGTAVAARVGVLYLSHHDPDRSDDQLDNVLADARTIFGSTELATESTSLEFANWSAAVSGGNNVSCP